MGNVRQPAIFLPHGGGPCFWIDGPPPFSRAAWDGLRHFLEGVLASLPEPPKAFLVCTAHWEEKAATVSVNPAPGMLYDYYNFPPHTYQLKYPAPGAPDAAQATIDLVRSTHLAPDQEWGLDHGAWSVLIRMFPKADIPVFQLSLDLSRAPQAHPQSPAVNGRGS